MGWSTADEKEFIDGLGTHRVQFTAYDKAYRLRLLGSYIQAIPFRFNWVKMDKQYITAYAKRQLAQEKRKVASGGILT